MVMVNHLTIDLTISNWLAMIQPSKYVNIHLKTSLIWPSSNHLIWLMNHLLVTTLVTWGFPRFSSIVRTRHPCHHVDHHLTLTRHHLEPFHYHLHYHLSHQKEPSFLSRHHFAHHETTRLYPLSASATFATATSVASLVPCDVKLVGCETRASFSAVGPPARTVSMN